LYESVSGFILKADRDDESIIYSFLVPMKLRFIRMFRNLLISGLILNLAPELWACRYNVRETGFVDLGLGSYRFICFSESTLPADQYELLESAAGAVLQGSSIAWESAVADPSPDHPAAVRQWGQRGEKLPAAALVSPSGRTLWLGPLGGPELAEDLLRDRLSEAVGSPLRRTIADELAASYGVVLLIKGSNESSNGRAETAIRQAIATIESELDFLPKPIRRGPAFVALEPGQRSIEKVLLWSLQLEEEDFEEPVVAVLYGRGRWIGPALHGEEITLDAVSRILFIIGADCECGLPPSLIRGTGIPIPWNKTLQARVTRELGFDPDNPLVRIEVGRILQFHSEPDGRSGSLQEGYSTPSFPSPETGTKASRLSAFQRLIFLLGGAGLLVLLSGVFLLFRAKRAEL